MRYKIPTGGEIKTIPVPGSQSEVPGPRSSVPDLVENSREGIHSVFIKFIEELFTVHLRNTVAVMFKLFFIKFMSAFPGIPFV